MAMGPDEFVAAVRASVYQLSVRSVMDGLRSPPGRSPAADLLNVSRWFARLDPSDRARIEWIVEETARVSVFGMLALLDGVRSHSSDPESALELSEVRPGGRTVICPTEGAYLHDRFNVAVPPIHPKSEPPPKGLQSSGG